MQNKYTSLKSGSAKFVENTAEHVHMLSEENQKLIEENAQLQKNLVSEQFLHSNLYKEWKQLQETAVEKENELVRYSKALQHKPSRLAFNGMLLITLLLTIVTFYSLFFNGSNKNKITYKDVSLLKADTLLKDTNQISASSPVNVMMDNETAGKDSFTTQNSTPAPRDTTIVKNTSEPIERNTAAPVKNNNSLLYKVRSKAYLYSAADSNMRLNAFIVHWNNSYITLKALDDKNGFIYVVFKNHLGQTSKGWLRKFDLYTVDNL